MQVLHFLRSKPFPSLRLLNMLIFCNFFFLMWSSWNNWNAPNKFIIIWHLDAMLELFQTSRDFDVTNSLARLWRTLFQGKLLVPLVSVRRWMNSDERSGTYSWPNSLCSSGWKWPVKKLLRFSWSFWQPKGPWQRFCELCRCTTRCHKESYQPSGNHGIIE